MVFFWVGIFCTYLLALFSVPRLRDALEPRLWRIFRTIALEYIAIAFTADFVTLHVAELREHPVSYLPFALMLVSGAGLRVVAYSDRKRYICAKTILRSPRSAEGLFIQPNVSRRSPRHLARVDIRSRYCGSVSH